MAGWHHWPAAQFPPFTIGSLLPSPRWHLSQERRRETESKTQGRDRRRRKWKEKKKACQRCLRAKGLRFARWKTNTQNAPEAVMLTAFLWKGLGTEASKCMWMHAIAEILELWLSNIRGVLQIAYFCAKYFVFQVYKCATFMGKCSIVFVFSNSPKYESGALTHSKNTTSVTQWKWHAC